MNQLEDRELVRLPCDHELLTVAANLPSAVYLLPQAEALDPEDTVLATLEKAAPMKPPNELKALLGRFQFQNPNALGGMPPASDPSE
eukprot:1184594-Prorocentrum_minimum.AAC.1